MTFNEFYDEQAAVNRGIEEQSAARRGEHRTAEAAISDAIACVAVVEALDVVTQEGGRVSISPPSNVKDYAKVLGSGVDTLVLTLDVSWEVPEFFEGLATWKAAAKAARQPVPMEWDLKDGTGAVFSVEPFGRGGYEWLLVGGEYSFSIGDWAQPGSRPSMVVEIRSETLWRLGIDAAWGRVVDMIQAAGGIIQKVKVSRADLCLDLRLALDHWRVGLLDQAVSRARKDHAFRTGRELSGLTFGQGVISLRCYDKVREIEEKSHKYWFADVWKIDLEDFSEQERVIRIEYQLRREGLKELLAEVGEGEGTLADFMEAMPKLWAYLTQEWLRFVDDASLHHTQQETLPWWKVVQEGFKGAQGATPATRIKASKADDRQLLLQIKGLVAAHAAIQSQYRDEYQKGLKFWFADARGECVNLGLTEMEFGEKVNEKRAKYFKCGAGLPAEEEVPAALCEVIDEPMPWEAVKASWELELHVRQGEGLHV